MAKPSKDAIKGTLRDQLNKVAAEGYSNLLDKSKNKRGRKYELPTEYGTYQVSIHLDSDEARGVVNILGAIDGPGVFHFLGYVSSVTATMSVTNATD